MKTKERKFFRMGVAPRKGPSGLALYTTALLGALATPPDGEARGGPDEWLKPPEGQELTPSSCPPEAQPQASLDTPLARLTAEFARCKGGCCDKPPNVGGSKEDVDDAEGVSSSSDTLDCWGMPRTVAGRDILAKLSSAVDEGPVASLSCRSTHAHNGLTPRGLYDSPWGTSCSQRALARVLSTPRRC